MKAVSTVRGWHPNPDPLFAAVRTLCRYDQTGRWSAPIYDGDGWPDVLAPFAAELHRLAPWFTIVIAQGYRDGNACVDWHNDGQYARQAILSLGATRPFGLRSAGTETTVWLRHGDLIEFPASTDHRVPPCVADERCSLVLRAVG